MKKYKYFIPVLFLLITGIQAWATNDWFTILANRGNFSFRLPSLDYFKKDTLRSLMYMTSSSDSAIGIQIHYIDSVDLSGNTELQQYISNNSESENPVLDAFAKMTLFLTQGELTSYQHISAGSNGTIPGIEIGVRQTAEDSTVTFSFLRIYYYNKKCYTFCILSDQSKLSDLLAYREQFFNSVVIN